MYYGKRMFMHTPTGENIREQIILHCTHGGGLHTPVTGPHILKRSMLCMTHFDQASQHPWSRKLKEGSWNFCSGMGTLKFSIPQHWKVASVNLLHCWFQNLFSVCILTYVTRTYKVSSLDEFFCSIDLLVHIIACYLAFTSICWISWVTGPAQCPGMVRMDKLHGAALCSPGAGVAVVLWWLNGMVPVSPARITGILPGVEVMGKMYTSSFPGRILLLSFEQLLEIHDSGQAKQRKGCQECFVAIIPSYFYALIHTKWFQLDFIAEDVGTLESWLDANGVFLAIHLDWDGEKNLQQTILDIVWAQYKQFCSLRASEDNYIHVTPALQMLVPIVYRMANLKSPEILMCPSHSNWRASQYKSEEWDIF